MEVQGGRCGYLALLGAIAAGAQVTYTPEEEFTLATLACDVKKLRERALKYKRSATLVINNKDSRKVFNTSFLSEAFKMESHGAYTVRQCLLSQIQQGNIPTPMDRINGALAARKAVEVMIESVLNKKAVVGGIGISSTVVQFTPIEELVKVMDFDNKRSTDDTLWWKDLERVIESLRTRPLKEPITINKKPGVNSGIMGKRKSRFPDGDKNNTMSKSLVQ